MPEWTSGFAFLELATQSKRMICEVEPNLASRLNDGRCDPAGRFWAGSVLAENAFWEGERKNQSTLYRLDFRGPACRC